MEKAREATDLANLRAAYAECSAAVLTGENTGKATVATDGSASATIDVTQKKKDWTGDNANAKIGTKPVKENVMKKDGVKQMTVTIAADGTVALADVDQ